MKLADLHIDTFGAQSPLGLSELSEHVNVLCGPNSSGKTTVIPFIRWMIFGQQDPSLRTYPQGSSPAQGSMVIREASGRMRTLKRIAQSASLQSHLTIDDLTHTSNPTIGLSLSEFDRFFVVNLERSGDLRDLCSTVQSYGFQLRPSHIQLDRLDILRDQLRSYQCQLEQLGPTSEVTALRANRTAKQRELESHERELWVRDQQVERQRAACQESVDRRRAAMERLRRVVENIEQAVDARKQQLADEHRQRLDACREAELGYRRRMEEIELQTKRWQDVLDDVSIRIAQLRERLALFGESSMAAGEPHDGHDFMRKIGFRLRDINRDLDSIHEADAWRDYEADIQYLRGLLHSGLNSMQGDVSRLCQTVERQKQASDLKDHQDELTYLCRFQQELGDLIESLGRQRCQLLRESQHLAPVRREDDAASTLGCGNETVDDFRLRHLVDRREAASAGLHEAARQLAEEQSRLRLLDEELAPGSRGHGIAQLQRELSEIETRLQQAEKRDQLERSMVAIQEELGRDPGPSEIVGEASTLLLDLTAGKYGRIRVPTDGDCEIERAADGQTCGISQLSRGTRDLAYLAMSLAIVAAYRRRGVVAPLILDDVFVHLDQRATGSLRNVLEEFAANGSQVLVMTQQERVRDLFDSRTTRVYMLGDFQLASCPQKPTKQMHPVSFDEPAPHAVPPLPTADLPPAPQDPTYDWVAEWHRRKPMSPSVAPSPEPKTNPTEDPDQDVTDVGIERPAELSLQSPISDAPVVSEDFVRCLRAVSVFTVEDFLELDPDDAATPLAEYEITSEMIQRRQRELMMCLYLRVCVPDAQLLVACGVPDPARLSRADEAVLLKRIESVLDCPGAVQQFGDASAYSVARVRSWIDAAQSCSYRRRPHGPFASNRPLHAPSQRGSGNGSATQRTAQPTVKMRPAEKLRFYLEVNDPVVDAPSIGPKTAEKLHSIEIDTVGNLLEADADSVAAQLSDRKISSDVVAQWQLQAQLVCRIPHLRGHDAQILVACGIEDPMTLSTLDASTFLKKVKRFVQSKEGQRIIRNAKKPDLAEVTAWIEWSESARQLRAA